MMHMRADNFKHEVEAEYHLGGGSYRGQYTPGTLGELELALLQVYLEEALPLGTTITFENLSRHSATKVVVVIFPS